VEEMALVGEEVISSWSQEGEHVFAMVMMLCVYETTMARFGNAGHVQDENADCGREVR
jgi:hypothetical protein